MSIDSIRFRAEGVTVVLQVKAYRESYGLYNGHADAPKWRDATVEDLLDVADCLRRQHSGSAQPDMQGWVP